jgi:hypothetical protein
VTDEMAKAWKKESRPGLFGVLNIDLPERNDNSIQFNSILVY